jgi:hypothetical protein
LQIDISGRLADFFFEKKGFLGQGDLRIDPAASASEDYHLAN